jgi:hypothetical protein
MELPTALLPKSPLLYLETWHVDEATAQLTVHVTSTQPLSHCPVCRCSTVSGQRAALLTEPIEIRTKRRGGDFQFGRNLTERNERSHISYG